MSSPDRPTTAVVFTERDATVIMNPNDPASLDQYDNVLINPDLSLVKDIPTKYWKMWKGKVLPMSDKDKAQREREIALASQMDAIKKKITRGRVLSIALSAMMGALTLWMLLHK